MAAQPNGGLPASLPAQIDLLVSLHLFSWPALSLAIQNAWGGSSQASVDKREWFAGAVSELLTSAPPQLADVDDLEEVLLQVMVDEFEVVVDDGSAEEVARGIWAGVVKLRAGEAEELAALYGAWEEKQRKGDKTRFVRGEDRDAASTDGSDDDDYDDEEWNGFPDRAGQADVDMEMGEAPPLVEARPKQPKAEPEIDEDGFTKVVGKKKR